MKKFKFQTAAAAFHQAGKCKKFTVQKNVIHCVLLAVEMNARRFDMHNESNFNSATLLCCLLSC